jgi:hypothetical protein
MEALGACTRRATEAGERMPVSSNLVMANWAAAMAMWALPYLALLHHFRIEPSQAMQWSLVVIGAIGSIGVFYMAWRESRRPSWRAAHGLRPLPQIKNGRR